MHRSIGQLILLFCCFGSFAQQSTVAKVAQNDAGGKKISPDLFGLFFEDINYSADGGLYAELVQNRSFEYNPADRKEWHSFSYWEYATPGFSYGKISVETSDPIHSNNPHYLVLTAEHIGQEVGYTGESGVGLKNSGFDGIVVQKGSRYDFSLFAKQVSNDPIALSITLQDPKGLILAEGPLITSSKEWTKYSTSLTATESSDSASLVILIETAGKVAMDMISLFPEKTFKNRTNGLRPDLAQLLADVQPKFVRFPGGCLVHGSGLGNMYRWKNTVGPVEQRLEQRNLWGYHQTVGLGFYEYFQFCEDIGAKPLPVLPAGVSCQNSGGTWRIGGTGQRALPKEDMQEYIQEVLDLIEWANGSPTSEWGAIRAAAGHSASFNLKYLGIGNEDKITPEFEERFRMIYEAVKSKYPEIVVIGTSGPFPDGEDFDKGWKYASALDLPMVDEHYYKQPEWMMTNLNRYDSYNREEPKVYLGEYASWGNKLGNAIAEAAYMIGLERNGDVVSMASYAPLLAKQNHTQWKTDLIFFDNVSACPTPNYYVQKLFSVNQGDFYFDTVFSMDKADTTLASSCVLESQSGDIILKIVNTGMQPNKLGIDLTGFRKLNPIAELTILAGSADAENTLEKPDYVTPIAATYKVGSNFEYAAPAMSLSVIRIKKSR